MRTVLIVGLSALGEGLARTLEGKVRLFAVDRLQPLVERQASVGTADVACLDASDGVALADFLRGASVDVAVVAIGGDFLSAEQVAETLRELETADGEPQVKTVVVTANRPYRARILEALGHVVVRPMIDAAESLAALVAGDGMDRFVSLGRVDDEASTAFGVADIPVPGERHPVRVDDLEGQVPGLRVLALRRPGGDLLVPPPVQVGPGGWLVVAGTPEVVARTSELLRDRVAGS